MPKYPQKKIAQVLLQACANNGIKQVVISPGSRNAPLTIGFVNHPEIETFSIVDERCAAFFALGLAQQSGETVALLCTSGSALLNYYPAIAEAYYSKIPLLVLSADRPKHLIDIGDGQTIRQEAVFSNHILFETCLESETELNAAMNQDDSIAENCSRVMEAIQVAASKKGPVHINVPFDEPLYDTVDHLFDFENCSLVQEVESGNGLLQEEPLKLSDLENYATIWNQSGKKLVLIGSSFPDELLQTQMNHIIKDPSVIVFTETTSNLNSPKFINTIDQAIFPLDDLDFAALKPDILLTFGGMIVSKKIKQILRKHQPQHHWHVDAHRALNTFHCMTRHFEISPQLFFSQFFFLTEPVQSSYQKDWLILKTVRKAKHKEFLENLEYSDLKVFELILKNIPDKSNVQIANSSAIRYTQLFDLNPSLRVFCNRGTSGIDGSTSTAIGAAYGEIKGTVLITGDISFFYDSNGLWNRYIPKEFRIILVNNQGGGIFKIIPGPSSSDALDYFETTHDLNARSLCEMFDFEYHSVSDLPALQHEFTDFFEMSNRPKLLEISTPSNLNDSMLKEYFSHLT